MISIVIPISTPVPFAQPKFDLDIKSTSENKGTALIGFSKRKFPFTISPCQPSNFSSSASPSGSARICFGLLYTTAAGGDFLVLWILRNIKPNTLVEDHPTNAGCYIIEQ
jgi:hypothetical protein